MILTDIFSIEHLADSAAEEVNKADLHAQIYFEQQINHCLTNNASKLQLQT